MLGIFTGLNSALENSLSLFILENENMNKDLLDGREQQLTAVISRGMLTEVHDGLD